MTRRRTQELALNPYIALADMSINLMLIFALMLPLVLLLGNRGWDEMKFRSYQDRFKMAINSALAENERPRQLDRHDAPGEQRWMFNKQRMFVSNDVTSSDEPELTPYGKRVLTAFASVLKHNDDIWWRVRVEAHVHQKSNQMHYEDERDSNRFTSRQAIVVSMYLFKLGIRPWRLTTSGRGHQDLLYKEDPASDKNDRVDLLIIPPPKDRSLAPILLR